MKRSTIIIVLSVLIQTTFIAQSRLSTRADTNGNDAVGQACLPGGIVFATQAEIDSFQADHPNCTEIEGYVTISGADITNLTGLSVVTSIGKNLLIDSNDSLTSLTGLDNVTSIGGYFHIGRYLSGNPSLASLTGLDNVTSIEGDFDIFNNHALTSLTGLDNLTSVGGTFRIDSNDTLTSLAGLGNLTSIGVSLLIFYNSSLTSITSLHNLTSTGSALSIGGNSALTSLAGLDNFTSTGAALYIAKQDFLTSLAGLDNLTSIGGNLGIWDNAALTSLAGLDNLTFIGTWLHIYDNPNLSNCEAQGLCEYLLNPNGSVYIINNAPGCNNPPEIADACEFTMPCLPFGDYNLTTQAEIDNFATDYPGCTDIGGDVIIAGDDITNLDGLSVLTTIGGDLVIGARYYEGNPILTDITGLGNLTSIGGYLSIDENTVLTNLAGLENIDAGSISDLYIYDNPSLSTCEVISVCDYLTDPTGEIYIYNNAPGCNDQYEVETACPVSVDEIDHSDKLFIYPNPSSTQITIELPNPPQKNAVLSISNVNSRQLISQTILEQKTVVDISGLPKGFYFVKVADDRTMSVGKLVKN